MKELQERLEIERQQWIENYMKKQVQHKSTLFVSRQNVGSPILRNFFAKIFLLFIRNNSQFTLIHNIHNNSQ